MATSTASAASTAVVPALPEPTPFEDLLKPFTTKTPDGGYSIAAQAHAAVALGTVVHDGFVKRTLSTQCTTVVKPLVTLLLQGSPEAVEVRWSVLAIMGELMRVEDRGDGGAEAASVNDIVKHNQTAWIFAKYIASDIPWITGTLQDISTSATEEGDRDTAEMCQEILAALPSKILNSPDGQEENKNSNKIVWTPEEVENAKNLMYLDIAWSNKFQQGTLEAVSKGSRTVCSGCGKKAEEGTPFNLRCTRCRSTFYCGAGCYKDHWTKGHKNACNAIKKCIVAGAGSNFRKVEGGVDAFRLLFIPSRGFAYHMRPEAMQNVPFDDYFMKYNN